MIVILGGGPGGRIASIRLASAGKEVTIVERGGIGGQCLHSGCIPVGALNDVARALETARVYRDLGITDSVPGLSFPKLLEEMRGVQDKIAGILDKETKQAGVEIVYGKTGRVEDGDVFIGEEKTAAESVIIATGSRPNIPDVPGIDLTGVYSPSALPSMKTLPQRLAIIGGGIMAAEYAYIFSRLGSDVTVLARSTFLKNFDRHLRALAIRELEGVEILEQSGTCSVNGDSRVESISVSIGNASSMFDTDAVLVAAGLVPRSEMIKGVDKGPAGEIVVDSRMRTSRPGVFACGDVTGPPYLTPVARYQGIIAADTILGRERTIDYRFVPQSLNLFHELAFCIPDPEGAASITIPGPAGPGTFWSVPSASTGLAKVLFNRDNGDIQGVCAAGPGGGLIAGYMAFLMRRHFSVQDFEEFIEVHPSTDGVYGLLKLASEKVGKDSGG